MKTIFMVLVFLYSLSAAAQVAPDGSYVNDDLIRPDRPAPATLGPRPPSDVPHPDLLPYGGNGPSIAVGEPNPNGPKFPKKLKTKKRKPSGFQPVTAGGQGSDFKDINAGGEIDHSSNGSK